MKTLTSLLIVALVGWFGASSRAAFAQDTANVTQLIRDSQTALAAEKYADAERLARSAIDLDPAHPPAWRQYGISLLKGGKPKEAVAALQRTVELDEKDASAWRTLALACWQLRQPNEAVRAHSAYLRLKPEDAAVWRDQASWLTQLQRNDQAIAALERVVELKPDDVSAWRELGAVRIRQKQDEQAIEAFEQVVKLRSDDVSAWRQMATALIHLERYEAAIAALERVVKLSPEDAGAWREMATCLIRLEQHDRAVTTLEQVVALKPDDASAWREMAAEQVRLERRNQAVIALERVVKIKPDDATAWREMATALTQLEQHERALAALERVVKLNPEDPVAWREMATVLTRLERDDQAISAIDRVLKLKSDDASTWRALALLHQRNGRLAEAAKAFEQALAVRPEDPATRRDLGWILWTLGRRKEAVERLTEAIDGGLEARDRVIYQVVARLSEEGAGADALGFLRKVNPNSPPSVLGLALARSGRLRAAEPILLNAWQNGDQAPDVGLYLAYVRAVNGQFADVDKYLEPLLKSASALSPERADLALEALRLGGTRPETPALMKRLESVLVASDRYSKRVTDILETTAEASRSRADHAQALQLYRRVLERDPERQTWIWAVLLAERVEGQTPFRWLEDYEKRVASPVRKAGIKGVMAERRGRAEEAIPALRQSIALDPKQPLLRQLLFDCLLRQGRVAEARTEADWFAKRVEAGEAVLRSHLADMLTRLGETRAALAHWELLRQANPDAPYYGIETATALYRLDRAAEAMEILQVMAGTMPDHRVFELMAEIETARGRTAQSVEWATRGLAIDPSPGLLRYQAEGLEKLQTNAPVALAAARTYLKQDPGYVPMTLLVGRMLETAATNHEVEAFHTQNTNRNPVFVPSLIALRDKVTRENRIDEAVEFARIRAAIQPDHAEALRAYANSLAQQDEFRKSLKILRPLARTPLEKAVPILVYASIARPPYAGRNSVDQISRHIKVLADGGVVFVNAFSQIAEKPEARHVMLLLIDPEAAVIEALDPVLKQYGACVVYAGNAAVPTLTLSGQPIPERLTPALTSGRWRLASGGPANLSRQPVNEAGVLGNPLTHPLMVEGKRETAAALSNRLDRVLAESAGTLKRQAERILVYPAGDFGHRSLDTGPDNLEILHNKVARHFTHAIYFDDSGFYLLEPRGDALRIPARSVPPEWDEHALATYLASGHPLTRARLELARVLYWHGQHEKSQAAFAEAEKAGADKREVLFNWGMNAERQGDIPTAKEKLIAAQALDPEAERIALALARLEARRRSQATVFVSGWKDNEDRDHYRYGGYGDTYVSERLRLGAAVDRDRWATDGIGSEYGTRVGLRGLAYLWPEIWLDGKLWYLDMDDLDHHWGGEASLRLPNPLLSGHLYLVAMREEIETVEALRENIDANTYALRTYTRLCDMYDLYANLSQIDRSDGNDTTMLDGKLLYRLHEWPYVGIGWRFRYADSDRDPPEYWAPEELEQHQLHINVRGAWDRWVYTVSGEAGYARESGTDWRFVWGVRGNVNYVLSTRFSVNGELGYFETTDYERWFGRLGLTGRF